MAKRKIKTNDGTISLACLIAVLSVVAPGAVEPVQETVDSLCQPLDDLANVNDFKKQCSLLDAHPQVVNRPLTDILKILAAQHKEEISQLLNSLNKPIENFKPNEALQMIRNYFPRIGHKLLKAKLQKFCTAKEMSLKEYEKETEFKAASASREEWDSAKKFFNEI